MGCHIKMNGIIHSMNEYGPHWHLSEPEAIRYNFRARDALQYTLRR